MMFESYVETRPEFLCLYYHRGEYLSTELFVSARKQVFFYRQKPTKNKCILFRKSVLYYIQYAPGGQPRATEYNRNTYAGVFCGNGGSGPGKQQTAACFVTAFLADFERSFDFFWQKN